MYVLQMVHLYQDPKGETVLGTSVDKTTVQQGINTDHPNTLTIVSDNRNLDEISDLKKEILELKSKLADQEV